MRLRLTLPGTVLLATVVALAGCTRDEPAWPAGDSPKVIASFAPIYCFAVNVAGPDAVVKPLMTTQGPHHFGDTRTEARLFADANLVFVNGLGLDNKPVERMAAASRNRKLKLVNLGAGLDAKKLLEASECGCHHEDGEGHDHDHDAPDPHVWLNPDYAAQFANSIRDNLKEAAPAHAADFDRRAAEFSARMEKLKAEGIEKLKGKTERSFVTFHGALGYFAQAFDLKIADVVQKVPGKEPTAKELEALVASCRKNNVRVIAVEPQYTSQTSAKRIVEELKLKGVADPVLVEIDPLETATDADLNAGWYESRMRANLDALAGVLK